MQHEAKFITTGDIVEFFAYEKVIVKSESDYWKEGKKILIATNIVFCDCR